MEEGDETPTSFKKKKGLGRFIENKCNTGQLSVGAAIILFLWQQDSNRQSAENDREKNRVERIEKVYIRLGNVENQTTGQEVTLKRLEKVTETLALNQQLISQTLVELKTLVNERTKPK